MSSLCSGSSARNTFKLFSDYVSNILPHQRTTIIRRAATWQYVSVCVATGSSTHQYRASVLSPGKSFFWSGSLFSKEAANNNEQQEKSVVESGERGVVLKHPVPKNYIEETLTPHLEDQIVHRAMALDPPGLVNVTEAYSRVPVTQLTVAKRLAEVVERRWDDITHEDCLRLLLPIWKLLGPYHGKRLLKTIAHRLSEHVNELSGINLLGVLRVYAKLNPSERPEPFFSQEVVPRVTKALEDFDTVELCDILAAISHQMVDGSDTELLELLLLQIERKYDDTSLLHTIMNLSSLCRLKIFHEGIMALATRDLTNRIRIAGLPVEQLAMITWVYARFGVLDAVLEDLLPLMETKAESFTVNEFARLSRALPMDCSIPERICLNLQDCISSMNRRDFTLFFAGCVSRHLFPLELKTLEHEKHTGHDENESDRLEEERCKDVTLAVNREEIWNKCLKYLEVESANINSEEVLRIVKAMKYSPEYRHLLLKLPTGWSELITEEMKR